MKLLLLLCLVVGPAFARAQTVKNNAVVIGRVDSVTSAVLKEKRTLWVYVPDGGAASVYAPQRYPVVYLLDGDAWFTTTTGVIQKLSELPNSVCPEMIVVGIPNTNRTRDLTPSASTTDDMPAEMLKASGGGENFTAFLEKELIPYVDAHYPTTAHRTLIGHSFGGLLVLNTLVHHPGLFDNYVAIDPSLFWDQEKLLQQAHEALARPTFAGRALFMASANSTGQDSDSLQVLQNKSIDGLFTRSKWKLRDELARNRRNGLRAAYRYYPADTHNTVPLPATYDALHFLFSAYALSPAATTEIFNPAAKVDQAAFLEAHYRQISAQAGYAVLPPEEAVNGLAYYMMAKGQAARALALLQLNARNYPTSLNVHDSLGDYYQAQGQAALARAAYIQALKLKEYPEIRQKLTKLQAKK